MRFLPGGYARDRKRMASLAEIRMQRRTPWIRRPMPAALLAAAQNGGDVAAVNRVTRSRQVDKALPRPPVDTVDNDVRRDFDSVARLNVERDRITGPLSVGFCGRLADEGSGEDVGEREDRWIGDFERLRKAESTHGQSGSLLDRRRMNVGRGGD